MMTMALAKTAKKKVQKEKILCIMYEKKKKKVLKG